MRVLIISDTHGRHTAFDRAIMEAGKIDYLVHLGDTEGGEDYIEAFCGCPAYILAGNNDFFSLPVREYCRHRTDKPCCTLLVRYALHS